MMRSLAVSVTMLQINANVNDMRQTVGERGTHVCGAIRRKCAVEPTREYVRWGENEYIDRITFVPAQDSFRFRCLPQTVYRTLVQSPDEPSVWKLLCWLIIHTCEGLNARFRSLS